MDQCANSPPGTFPFLPCPLLEDLADLYLYRFDSTIDFDALAAVSAAVREQSRCEDLDPPEFERQACAAIQDLQEVYFMEDWHDPELVEVNRKRLQVVRRRYLSGADSLRSLSWCPLDPREIPSLTEKVWDFAISPSGGLALVHVTADYCSACNDFEPNFRAAAETLQERCIANCYTLNGSQSPGLIAKLGVKAYPCVVLFSEGQEVGRILNPSRYTLTDLVNFVLDRRYELEFLQSSGAGTYDLPSVPDGAEDPARGAEDPAKGDPGADSWTSKLRSQGIDMLEQMEIDRRNVLLHEKFRALGMVDAAAPDEACPRPPDDRPRIIFLGGGMGAGKSTVVRTMATTTFWQTRGERVVIIEADAFKMQDPLFAALLHANVQNAAEIVHSTSTATAEELLLDALQRGRDIVFDGTLSWEPFVQQTVQMVRQAHRYRFERGPGWQQDADGQVTELYWVQKEERETPGPPYVVEMVGVTVDPQVAVQRGIVRRIISGRAVPVRGQLQSHKLFSSAFERYLQLFDAVALVDNNGLRRQAAAACVVLTKGSSILRSCDGSEDLYISDAEAYERFLRKQLINVDATGLRDAYETGSPCTTCPLTRHCPSAFMTPAINLPPLPPSAPTDTAA